MSADNYIYVDTIRGEVWNCTASCVCGHKKHHLGDQKVHLISKGKNLKQLIDIAKDEDSDSEYGTFFDLWCK
jgi:hypothetical protein